MLPEISLLSTWQSHAYALPVVLCQPFSIFGTLSIAESQVRERKDEALTGTRSRSRSSSRTRPRKMVTSSFGSVLGLYRQLPKALYRILKAMLLNVIADSLTSIPVECCTRTRSPLSPGRIALDILSSVVTSVVVAPIRLLHTEVVVFRRFDWRSLQLNSRILPIFAPNLCKVAIAIGMNLLSPILNRRWDRFCEQLVNGLQLSLYRTGLDLSLVLSLWLSLYVIQVLTEIIRVRVDLLVLNGDSTHSIVKLDESFEGGLSDALTSTKDYSIRHTIKRYLQIASLPELVVSTLAKLSIPLIDMSLRP